MCEVTVDAGEMSTSELAFAAKSGNMETVQYVVEGLSLMPDERDVAGKRPLHWACYEGSVDVASYLIKRGAKVHDEEGLPPLHIAASWGSVSDVGVGQGVCSADVSGCEG